MCFLTLSQFVRGFYLTSKIDQEILSWRQIFKLHIQKNFPPQNFNTQVTRFINEIFEICQLLADTLKISQMKSELIFF